MKKVLIGLFASLTLVGIGAPSALSLEASAPPQIIASGIGEIGEAYDASAQVSLRDPSSYLNARAVPGTEAAIIGRFWHGERVQIERFSDGWYFVQSQETRTFGWVDGRYLTFL